MASGGYNPQKPGTHAPEEAEHETASPHPKATLPVTPPGTPPKPAPTKPNPPDPDPTKPGPPQGDDAHAARTRVGTNPAQELIGTAIDHLQQRIIDRLGPDHVEGAKAEFDAYRQRAQSILGPPQ